MPSEEAVFGVVATVEEYDPNTDTWTVKAPMPTARQSLGAALANGKIYAIGGIGVSSATLATVEEFIIPGEFFLHTKD